MIDESHGLFLLRIDEPSKRFLCRSCGETHLNGQWARNDHRLLVLCAPVTDADARTIQTSPAEILDLAQAPSIDDGIGFTVDCAHRHLPASCLGQAFATEHGMAPPRCYWRDEFCCR